MIGYAYLDFDGNLVHKTKRYIEEDDPLFWQNNRNLIVDKWRFDTEDMGSMINMFRRIKDRKIPNQTVVDFAKSISFDLNTLPRSGKAQENAGKV
ncbi:hypothetical protein D3C87_279740 [compost metagenome]